METSQPLECYDTIVVGAGITGLIATRELEMLGRRVLLLEARDRLGGRTWTDRRLGCELELGGTYVHWYQPHIWSELTRYHLDVFQTPAAKKAYWITDGQLRSGTSAEINSLLNESFEQMMKAASKALPNPHDPFQPSLCALDEQTIVNFVEEFDLTNEQRDLISASLGINFNGPPEEGAVTQMLRWWAFSHGSRSLFTDTVGRYKIKGGTKALIDSIASDLKADIKYSSAVVSVKGGESGVVETTAGEVFHAKSVIVTVPLSTLDKIHFSPELSNRKQHFIKEKQVSRGIKVWARIKGLHEPFITYAPADFPLQSIHFEQVIEGDSIVVGFGSNADILDHTDCKAVEEAIQSWLPGVDVIEATGHNWSKDVYSMETWPMLKPGQLTSYMEEMKRPENGVFLAGTTFANGWAGFIDGGIESGIITSRKVHQYLEKESLHWI